MPVTNYYTVNGRLLGESTSGVRSTYVADALGSIINKLETTHQAKTYRYKPYGGLLYQSGRGADPKFMWTGQTGSRTTGVAWAEQYNRARHYGTTQAQWTTRDPLWPIQPAYIYAGPVQLVDPFGLLQDCNDEIVGGVRQQICKQIHGFLSRVACQHCSSWCKCSGHAAFEIHGSGNLTVIKCVGGHLICGLIAGYTPCSLKGTFECNIMPTESKTCPTGQKCQKPLPPCLLNRTPDNRHIADISGQFSKNFGSLLGKATITWKITNIYLMMKITGQIKVIGCKKC